MWPGVAMNPSETEERRGGGAPGWRSAEDTLGYLTARIILNRGAGNIESSPFSIQQTLDGQVKDF